ASHLYTLSLHDALPISRLDVRVDGARFLRRAEAGEPSGAAARSARDSDAVGRPHRAALGWRAAARESALSRRARRGQRRLVLARSEEHTSELQSRGHLV